MNSKEIIKKIKASKKEIKKFGIKKIGLFGSFAKDKQNKKSDIDLLIEMNSKSLLDLVKLKIIFEKKFKRKVDLIEYSTLHPLIKESALKEEIRIL
jgi:hypothetical protein